MGSVFSTEPKLGEASAETKENSPSVRFDFTGIMPKTKRNQSASDFPRFVAPTQEIRTCGGQSLLEP